MQREAPEWRVMPFKHETTSALCVAFGRPASEQVSEREREAQRERGTEREREAQRERGRERKFGDVLSLSLSVISGRRETE